MKAKLTKALIVPLVLGLIGISAPARAGNDLSWIPDTAAEAQPTIHSLALADKLPLPEELSWLSVYSNPNTFVCKSTSDPACALGNEFNYLSILKVCAKPTDVDCVSQVNAIDAKGVSTAATFSKYTITNHLNAFPADPKAGIPEGSMPSIWSIPSAPHKSGSDYAVFAGIKGNVNRNGDASSASSYMQLSLIPVVLKDFGKGHQSISTGWSQAIPGIYYDYCANSQEAGKPVSPDCSHVNGQSCLFATVDQGMCYAEEAFGEVQKFNVQLKLSKEPTGWMHGRMVDPSISINHEPSGAVDLSVTVFLQVWC